MHCCSSALSISPLSLQTNVIVKEHAGMRSEDMTMVIVEQTSSGCTPMTWNMDNAAQAYCTCPEQQPWHAVLPVSLLSIAPSPGPVQQSISVVVARCIVAASKIGTLGLHVQADSCTTL